jgi:hypothetical protein
MKGSVKAKAAPVRMPKASTGGLIKSPAAPVKKK